MALLELRALRVLLGSGPAAVRAVDDVSLVVERGEVLALVGESGSGKTALCLAVLGLLPREGGRATSGQVLLEQGVGEPPIDLVRAPEALLRSVRGRRIGMVFQDPMTALNPYLRVGVQVGEARRLHRGVRGPALQEAVRKLLAAMGLPRPDETAHRFPHELSGGQRQRVLFAAALAAEPDLLLADEPTTALDVTIQAQVLELVAGLVRDRALGVLWVTHDLGVVAQIADRVAVMYAGRIVEQGPVHAILGRPQHPYTQALRAAAEWLDAGATGEPVVTDGGAVGPGAAAAAGCPYEPRCPRRLERCRTEPPPLQIEERKGRAVRCHLDLPPEER